jgi:single-strand DNA-binding protein
VSGDATVTFVGNLAGDPELRFTATGVAVAGFQVAVQGRTKDVKGEWQDAEAFFYRCTVWRDHAEHVAESLGRGDRVVVTGTLRPNTYETKEGEKRQSLDVQVDEVAPSLRFATVKITRTARAKAAV